MKSLLLLGRQPALGLAELESLYGEAAIKHLRPNAALVDLPAQDINFERLGGSIKLATVLNVIPSTSWDKLEDYLAKTIPEHLQYVPEGKFKLGISVYGIHVNPRAIQASALRLKKIIKAEGRSVRIIPNKTPALNSAQVIHNQLTTETGWELVFYRDGDKTILALTKAEQNIDKYARRDQNRPYRDAKVGMLPPKLAQIIINLATGDMHRASVLDPFCGTGVVLQEALLMGYDVYGTDLEPRMIEYTKKNLDWLANSFTLSSGLSEHLEVGDATKFKWTHPFSVVAAETYLGKPLSKEPAPDLLKSIMTTCDRIHMDFLKNIGTQLKSGSRLCLAVPAWKTKSGFKHLLTLDKLHDLGYTRLSFAHSPTKEMLYYREDQLVARELVVLRKD